MFSLRISLEKEIANTQIAGNLGVALRVINILPDNSGFIMEYLKGIPLNAYLLKDDRVISAVLNSLKKLHKG